MIFNEREYGTQEISKNIRQEIKFRGVVLINVPVDRSKKNMAFSVVPSLEYIVRKCSHMSCLRTIFKKKGHKNEKTNIANIRNLRFANTKER